MRRRIVLVLVLAAVVGLITSTMVYRILSDIARPEKAETIVVASVNIGMAETITSQHVRLVAWPKASIPSGAVRSLAEAEGRVVRGSIVAGEPLLDGKLAPQLSGKGGLMPMLVPEGLRGITIKVDDATRESGFVLPNSRVDVLVSMPRSPGSQERVSKVILQDIGVLAAGQTVELRDNKPVTVTTVTLALAPHQAEKIGLAQTEGKLMLAMRNLRDNKVVETRGATAATLLTDSSAPAPTPAKPRPRIVSAPLPPPRVETYAITVLRGGKPAEQVFVRDVTQEWVDQSGKK
jgi:pilus assembly protein CpaB